MKANRTVIRHLCDWMRVCRNNDVSFDACLSDARKQFNREVREETDSKPLPQPK